MGAVSVEPSAEKATQPAADTAESRYSAGALPLGIVERFAVWRNRYWAVVPLLAVAAYVSVLRIGFLSDDLMLLLQARDSGVDLSAIVLPNPDWLFYRPLGTLLTWQLGWQLWGLNPLPYHLAGLLLHAGTALALGLWLAEATSGRWLGWLAGALFSVFPLHIEAVGWVAAQWDLWAAFFGVLGLYFFTVWWRRSASARRLKSPGVHYALSVLFYGLGLFSKESLIAFLPVYAAAVWLVTPRLGRREWAKLALSLLPFVALLALNVGLRLFIWGRLGGYPWLRSDYIQFFWEGLAGHGWFLLAPINSSVLGSPTAQIVGALSSVALLLGLLWFGRSRFRLLCVAGAWVVLALVPVVNLPLQINDMQQNRLLYLAAGGYCVGVAALLHAAIASATNRWRQIGIAFAALLLLAATVVSWVHLRPLHTASVISRELDQELLRLVPPQVRPQPMVWHVENTPDTYQGAYLFRLGLGAWRALTDDRNDLPTIEKAWNVERADLITSAQDAFALRFRYYSAETRHHVAYAAGLTQGTPPPTSVEAEIGLLVWDFTDCSPDTVAQWSVVEAQATCERGKGLSLQPSSADPQMVGPDIQAKVAGSGARFVRLRVSAGYPAASQPKPQVLDWFWKTSGSGFDGDHNRNMLLKQDGKPHVYWTFVPAAEAGDTITGLRFDPINAQVPAQVQWIALDLVR